MSHKQGVGGERGYFGGWIGGVQADSGLEGKILGIGIGFFLGSRKNFVDRGLGFAPISGSGQPRRRVTGIPESPGLVTASSGYDTMPHGYDTRSRSYRTDRLCCETASRSYDTGRLCYFTASPGYFTRPRSYDSQRCGYLTAPRGYFTQPRSYLTAPRSEDSQ